MYVILIVTTLYVMKSNANGHTSVYTMCHGTSCCCVLFRKGTCHGTSISAFHGHLLSVEIG